MTNRGQAQVHPGLSTLVRECAAIARDRPLLVRGFHTGSRRGSKCRRFIYDASCVQPQI